MPTPMPFGQAVSNSTAATGSPTAAWAVRGPESTIAIATITPSVAHRTSDRHNLLRIGLASQFIVSRSVLGGVSAALSHQEGANINSFLRLRGPGWPTMGPPDPSGGAHATLWHVSGGRFPGLRARGRARCRRRPGTAPAPAAREARHGGLSYLVRARRPGAVHARGRAPALVLVRRGGEGLRRGRGGRPLVRDGPMGSGHEPVPPDLGGPHPGGGEARAGGGGEGAGRRRAHRARARLRRRGRDILPRRGHRR